MKLATGGKPATTDSIMRQFIEKHPHSILLISNKKIRDKIVKQYAEMLSTYKVNVNRIVSVESLKEAQELFEPIFIYIDEAGSLLGKVLGLKDIKIAGMGVELSAENCVVEALPIIVERG